MQPNTPPGAIRTIGNDWSVSAITAGFLAVLISYAGPLAIFFQASQAAHASNDMVSSWVWAISIGAGVSGLFASWKLKVPAWPPAPISIWISSMNRMTGTGDFAAASSNAFRRASNSPFMLAPASNAPTSRLSRRTSASFGGTLPDAIAPASPSTTAVLPTPASPVTSGLFCLRRSSTSIIVRISSSRPMTGSISPARARAVRSAQYWSSVPPFGAPGVAPDASPGVAGRYSLWSYGASSASGEPAIQAGSTSSKPSTGILPNAGEIASMTRRNSGTDTSAAISHAPRTRRSPYSSVARTQARSIADSICHEKSLIELAPAGKAASARAKSRSSPSRSIAA